MGILRAREYPFPHDVDADAAAMTEGFLVSGGKVAAIGLGLPFAVLDAGRGVARVYDLPGTVYEGLSPLHALMALSRDVETAVAGARGLISGCTRCAIIDRLDVPWRILEAALASPGTPAEVRDEMTWKRVLCGEDGVCVCMTPRGLCALDTARMRGVGFWPAEDKARHQIGEAGRRDWYLANAPWRRMR